MEPEVVAWLTATQAIAAVRKGRLDPAAVAGAHLDRIRRLDPALGAFVHVPEAAAAGAGPLAGVSLAVKDTQAVAGMPWTFGSRRWLDRVAAADEIVVERARAAGCAVVGKTNTPELAASVSTVNESFPPTQNPWQAGITPGGSSGGSAAAVAAGLCTFAFGDDMGGSIRIPSACCGVLGLRPTAGRLPVLHPDPTRLSVKGPLARSAADLRLALGVMAGDAPPFGFPMDLRVAVTSTSPLPVHPACADAVLRAAAALEAAGLATEEAPPWDPEPVATAYRVVRPASVAPMPGDPEEYGEAAGRLIAQGRAIPVASLLDALSAGMAAAQPLRELLQRVHVLVTPTLGLPPMPIDRVPPFLGDDWIAFTQFVLPVSFSGLPAVSVPAGTHDGLPVGVQLVGRPYEEWRLLSAVELLEAQPGFGFQRPPGWD